jgi:hypothetical protein
MGVGGRCSEGGACLCEEGFTGRSDWISMEGKDCNVSMNYMKFNTTVGMISLSVTILQCLRLIRKTYKSSQRRDKNLKGQLAKAQNIIALCLINASVPVLVLSAAKLISPETYMLDPTHNPVFFVYFFVALNSEWLAYSKLYCSIVSSVTKGIHDQSDREIAEYTRRVQSISKRVPATDLMLKMGVFVVPGLIGGYSNNAYNLLVVSALGCSLYPIYAYMIFPFVWARSIYFAVKIATKKVKTKNNRSQSSGSTANDKLLSFKRKMSVFITWIILVVLIAFYYTYDYVFSLKPHFLTQMTYRLMCLYGRISIFWFLMLEVLYFNLVERVLNIFRKCRSFTLSPSPPSSTDLTVGPQNAVVKMDTASNFSHENPITRDAHSN